MALSRISSTSDVLTALSRISHSACASLGEMQQCTRYAAVHQNRIKGLHVTSVRRYPDPPTLPLPTNVSEIFANETGRFTPERSRDIAAPVLLYGNSSADSLSAKQTKQPFNRSTIPIIREDMHVDSYDCFGAVSLNGIMQSNVPKPFSSNGKSMHLNMPGGQWARDGKYIAENMQKSHYRSIRFPQFKLDNDGPANKTVLMCSLMQAVYEPRYICSIGYSTNAPKQPKSTENFDQSTENLALLSKKERFRRIVRDYGRTVIVFHIGISLISLGAFYTAVISGLDLTPLVQKVTGGGSEQLEKLMTNSSNFLLAYTIHKLFAPVRLSITFGVTPLLVRYLRRIGVLKPGPIQPKSKVVSSNTKL